MKMRICLFKIFIMVFFISNTSTYGQAERKFSELEKMVITATGEIVKLFQEDSESIWPGFDMSVQPFIVYIPDKWVLLVNYNNKVEGFSSYPEDWPAIYTEAQLRTGNLKGLNGQLQFGFNIDTIETLAIGFPEGFFKVDDPFTMIEIIGFIIHESFHQYQRQAFGEIPWAREEKYPILDAENTALAYIEMKILINALKAMYTDDEVRCKELLKDFVVVREKRWRTAGDFVSKYEQGQELNEGTAKYAEVKSIQLLRKSLDHRINSIDPVLHDILSSDRVEGYLEQEFYRIMGDNYISPEDMIRNRIYPTGAAEGILLDYTGLNWKTKAQEAGADFTFSGLMSDSFDKNAVTYHNDLSMILEEYNYQKTLSNTIQQIKEYTDLYHTELKKFESQEGIRIEVLFNYKSLSRAGNTRAKKWTIENGSESLCMNYRLFKLKTEAITCLFENIAVYQNYDWDNKQIRLVIYTDDQGSMLIDKNEQPIYSINDSRFKDLCVKGKGVEINIRHAGRIQVTEQGIMIYQNQE